MRESYRAAASRRNMPRERPAAAQRTLQGREPGHSGEAIGGRGDARVSRQGEALDGGGAPP